MVFANSIMCGKSNSCNKESDVLYKEQEVIMLKFTMNAKDLKEIMRKGMAAINKKVSLDSLRKLYLQVEPDGTVKALGTDMEHFAEIRTNNAFDTSPGVLGIDIDDIKIISKMNGEVTLEDVSTKTQQRINIKCGKRLLLFHGMRIQISFFQQYDDMTLEQERLAVEYETKKLKPKVDDLKSTMSKEQLEETIHEWWLDYQIADETENNLIAYIQ